MIIIISSIVLSLGLIGSGTGPSPIVEEAKNTQYAYKVYSYKSTYAYKTEETKKTTPVNDILEKEIYVYGEEALRKQKQEKVAGIINQQLEEERIRKEKEEEARRIAEQKRLEEEAAKKRQQSSISANQQLGIGGSAPAPSGSYNQQIQHWCAVYGCDSYLLIRVMMCESSGNPLASNNGIYLGLFQFHRNTFNSYASGLISGADIWNASHQIQVAAWMFANGQAHQWECTHKV
jgi:soluble lytic murein transglycosylase-like protein